MRYFFDCAAFAFAVTKASSLRDLVLDKFGHFSANRLVRWCPKLNKLPDFIGGADADRNLTATALVTSYCW